MALEQLTVGVDVPTADGRDQLGVRGPVGAVQDGLHKEHNDAVEKRSRISAS
jgi:hypothetical protein